MTNCYCLYVGYNGSSCLQLSGIFRSSNLSYDSIVPVPLISIPFITYSPSIKSPHNRRTVNNTTKVKLLGVSSDPICVKLCVATQDTCEIAVLLSFRRNGASNSETCNSTNSRGNETNRHQILLLPPEVNMGKNEVMWAGSYDKLNRSKLNTNEDGNQRLARISWDDVTGKCCYRFVPSYWTHGTNSADRNSCETGLWF